MASEKGPNISKVVMWTDFKRAHQVIMRYHDAGWPIRGDVTEDGDRPTTMFQQSGEDRLPKITLGMSQRSEVGGRKSRPNKTKLAQAVHKGLVYTCAKVGNIRITGDDGKCVMTVGDRGVSDMRC